MKGGTGKYLLPFMPSFSCFVSLFLQSGFYRWSGTGGEDSVGRSAHVPVSEFVTCKEWELASVRIVEDTICCKLHSTEIWDERNASEKFGKLQCSDVFVKVITDSWNLFTFCLCGAWLYRQLVENGIQAQVLTFIMKARKSKALSVTGTEGVHCSVTMVCPAGWLLLLSFFMMPISAKRSHDFAGLRNARIGWIGWWL